MKILVKIILIAIFSNSIFAQESSILLKEVVIKAKVKDKRTLINEKRTLFVNRQIDSLNNFNVTEDCILPAFFTNPNFDHQYGNQFMHGMHGRISLRKLIIDKLTNYFLMLYVLQSKDKRVRKKYKGRPKRFYLDYSRIPFEQFSTYELVDLRLDEMDNEDNIGIKRNY